MKKKELEKKYAYDLTKKEREMERIIRKIIKEEKKKKGKEVKVGYIKMRLVWRWFKWNEKHECLSEEKERRGKQ